MKDYLNPNKLSLRSLYLLLAGEAALFFLAFRNPRLIFLYLLILAGLCMLYVLIRVSLHNSQKYKSYISELEQNGEFAAAEKEFTDAGKAFGDQLRTGERHLFIREAGQMIPYSSVDSIHRKITLAGGKEKNRCLLIQYSEKAVEKDIAVKDVKQSWNAEDLEQSRSSMDLKQELAAKGIKQGMAAKEIRLSADGGSVEEAEIQSFLSFVVSKNPSVIIGHE